MLPAGLVVLGSHRPNGDTRVLCEEASQAMAEEPRQLTHETRIHLFLEDTGFPQGHRCRQRLLSRPPLCIHCQLDGADALLLHSRRHWANHIGVTSVVT